MAVTLSPIVTLVKLLQFENALSPMLVTLSEIVILVRPLQFENVYSPMLVTPSVMVMSLSIEQLINAPYRILPPVTVTLRSVEGI